MSSIADAVRKKFEDEVRSWNWEKVVSLAKENVEYDFDSDSHMGTTWLGTIFGLMPSGKYYTPFACSNIDPCPHCGGTGRVPNLNANPTLRDEAHAESRALRKEMMAKHGPWFAGNWPKFQQEAIQALDDRARSFETDYECPFCCGLGSEEAFHDALMQQVLEEVAEDHGGYIHYGEDSDIFFAISVEVEDAE